jgi:hypothetical protein
MRRILIIVLVVVAVIIILGVGYFLATRKSGTENEAAVPYESVGNLPAGTPGKSGGTLPSVAPQAPAAPGGATAKQRFGVVAQVPVTDYFVDSKNVVFIIQPDGKILSITGTAQTPLNTQTIDGDLIRASFSADGKKVLAVFGKASAPQTSVFDIAAKRWDPLSIDIKEPTWSPTGTKIAFLSANSSEFGVLATLDLAQTKPTAQPLTRVYAQDVTLNWPTAETIVLSERSSAYAKSSVWRVDVKSKTMTTLVDALLGASAAWTPDVSLGVLFTGNRAYRGGAMSLVDGAGDIKKQLDIATFPEKCAFTQADIPVIATSTATSTPTSTAKQNTKAPAPPKTERIHTLYCGFPKNTTELNLLPQPDGYRQKKVYTDDYFYKIDMKSGTIANISPPNEYVLDGINLKVFGANLFFVNRYDNYLYSLALD